MALHRPPRPRLRPLAVAPVAHLLAARTTKPVTAWFTTWKAAKTGPSGVVPADAGAPPPAVGDRSVR